MSNFESGAAGAPAAPADGWSDRRRSAEGRLSRLTITWKSGVRERSRRWGRAGEDGLEGHVLVRIGAERDLPDPRHELPEARLGRPGRCAEPSVLRKQPISSSISTRAAAGHRSADQDVVLAAVAVQQGLDRGEQDHEQRGALGPSEAIIRDGEGGGQGAARRCPPR